MSGKYANKATEIKFDIVPYTRGRGLDIGCGYVKTYPHFIGVDNLSICPEPTPHEEMALKIAVDIVSDASNLSFFASQSMDFVFSSYLLHEMENPMPALKEWWRVIKPGGHLVVYVPFSFDPESLMENMKSVGGWDLVLNEDKNDSVLQAYKKYDDRRHVVSFKEPRPTKTVGVVRYGGVGDMIQTSSVIKQLKKQGYHVTLFCNPAGKELMKHDPYIDEFFVQDKDQVINEELFDFWVHWSKKFDKWCNFSESVEGSLLALPGRPAFYFNKSARHCYTNHNYLEFMHLMSDTPYDPCPRFYPTIQEQKWAKKQHAKIGKCIVWGLSGSGVNKAWPYLDNVVAKIMLELPNWKVVFVGAEMDAGLQSGWENEPRVVKKCGKWTMRETLSFAQVADIVVGPETGLLNAVSFLPTPKILFLSHSTVDNLSRDWENCISLSASDCECYPCHKMIYNFSHCNRDEATGVSKCQAMIDKNDFWFALVKQIDRVN